MKVEIELTIDANGNPYLELIHHDKSDELEQKLLGVFLKKASESGLFIGPIGGSYTPGTKISYEKYLIKPA